MLHAALSMAREKMISGPCFQQRAASAAPPGWESSRVHGRVGCRVKRALEAIGPPQLRGQSSAEAGAIELKEWSPQIGFMIAVGWHQCVTVLKF